MSPFVPDGFISLSEAFDRVAAAWAGDTDFSELLGKTLHPKPVQNQSAILAALVRHWREPFNSIMRDRKVLDRQLDERAKSLEKFVPRLRNDLFNEHLPTYLLENDGTLRPFLSKWWGGEFGDRILSTVLRNPCPSPFQFFDEGIRYNGYILVAEDELSSFLSGEPAKKRTACLPLPDAVANSPSGQKSVGRRRPKRDRAHQILLDEFPDRFPSEMTNPELLSHLSRRIDEAGISNDTMLRVAGRKK